MLYIRYVKNEPSTLDDNICNQMGNLTIVKDSKPSENDCLKRNLGMPMEDMISDDDVHTQMMNLKIWGKV